MTSRSLKFLVFSIAIVFLLPALETSITLEWLKLSNPLQKALQVAMK